MLDVYLEEFGHGTDDAGELVLLHRVQHLLNPGAHAFPAPLQRLQGFAAGFITGEVVSLSGQPFIKTGKRLFEISHLSIHLPKPGLFFFKLRLQIADDLLQFTALHLQFRQLLLNLLAPTEEAFDLRLNALVLAFQGGELVAVAGTLVHQIDVALPELIYLVADVARPFVEISGLCLILFEGEGALLDL